MDKQSRALALSGAHRGRAAPGRLTLPGGGVFRLTTPLLRQWLMIHLRPSAGLRLSGGFGYLDAPPAFSILEQSFAARCIGWVEVFELSTP